MLKILFFNNYEEEGMFILFGIQIFRLVIGLGYANGRYDNIMSFGIIGTILDK